MFPWRNVPSIKYARHAKRPQSPIIANGKGGEVTVTQISGDSGAFRFLGVDGRRFFGLLHVPGFGVYGRRRAALRSDSRYGNFETYHLIPHYFIETWDANKMTK